MNKTITWWTGWIVLIPFRIVFLLYVFVICLLIPKYYYGLVNEVQSENNPDNWKQL